jgi:hypothetical protein
MAPRSSEPPLQGAQSGRFDGAQTEITDEGAVLQVSHLSNVPFNRRRSYDGLASTATDMLPDLALSSLRKTLSKPWKKSYNPKWWKSISLPGDLFCANFVQDCNTP